MGHEILYGDGIHDDRPAIQQLLDSGVRCIRLPEPPKQYRLSGTLYIHGGQTLVLDAGTTVKLLPGANCAMLENAEPDAWCEDISVIGGIWDMNHAEQNPNPYHFPDPVTGKKTQEVYQEIEYTPESGKMPPVYTGMCFRFSHIRRFRFSDITIVNPVTYGMQCSYVEDFTIENLQFDYTEGSPKLWNMDGIHIEGGCKNGLVRNLKGACHDDLVAITSDDSIWGPIENITVDGIYAEHCHSAVRLLSVALPVRNIHITNIYGSYYVYCITLSKYYQSEARSGFDNICIDHVYASVCEGTVDVGGNYEPLIAIGSGMDIRRLSVSHLYRHETRCPLAAIGVAPDTVIERLSVSECDQTTSLDAAVPFLENRGTIEKLYLVNVENKAGEVLVNHGTVSHITEI